MKENTCNNTGWPPPHRFRRSKKARHINLRFIPGEGVEIVLPEKPVFASEQMGLTAMERHREWVLRQIARQVKSGSSPQLNGFTGSEATAPLPGEFALHGGAVPVRLEWGHRDLVLPMPPDIPGLLPVHPAAGGLTEDRPVEDGTFANTSVAPARPVLRQHLPEQPQAATSAFQAVNHPPAGNPQPDYAFAPHLPPGSARAVQVPPASPLLCRLKDGTDAEKRKRLFLWLRKYAGAFLSARLQALSVRHGIPYTALRIGWQKSRWGSYSCRGSIRLNAKLIFLPPQLSDLVILHELCHSTEMSHNQNFWQNLEKLEPRAKELDRQLNRAASGLPDWVKKFR